MNEELSFPSGEEKNKVEGGVLYLVATPIGNLSDLSERAKKVLSGVDFVAAEDTRNSGKLLSLFGIRKPFVSYYEHNKRERGPEIVRRLLAGESCALVTDAGTPAVSDPGEELVRLCAESGVRVTGVPGCCAAVNALSLSALSTARFAFEGFLPRKGSERKKRLSALRGDTHTLIFYEAPHHLRETLADLYESFGDRKISLCRELTKKNEEILRLSLGTAVAYYEENEPRGEYVLVMEGCCDTAAAALSKNECLTALSPDAHLQHYLDAGLSRMDAMKAAAKDRGMSKSAFYKLVTNE